MRQCGRGGHKHDRLGSERVTLVPEPNEDGTWGLTATYLRPDGSKDKRVLAVCERQSDACRAMRQLWSDIWSPAATASANLNPAAL